MVDVNRISEVDNLRYLLDNEDVQAALLLVCTSAEKAKSKNKSIYPFGKEDEYKELLDELFAICVREKLIHEFALLYQATGYIPHGKYIQPMFDFVLIHYIDRKDELNEMEKANLRIFIKLSLEAYDKLTSFIVFFDEFRQFISYDMLPKALTIAEELKNSMVVEKVIHNYLQPPREVDESGGKND